MRSLVVAPTRLFDAPTVPLRPAVPLTHVTAPASGAPGASHSPLTTTKLPFASSTMPPDPAESPALVPVSVVTSA
jgi:hypothetical protein